LFLFFVSFSILFDFGGFNSVVKEEDTVEVAFELDSKDVGSTGNSSTFTFRIGFSVVEVEILGVNTNLIIGVDEVVVEVSM